MPTLEERVASLEGRMVDQTAAVGDLRGGLAEVRRLLQALDLKIDTRFDSAQGKTDSVQAGLDAKIDALEARLDAKIDSLGNRLDARIDNLDSKVSRHFTWLVGIQVGTLVLFTFYFSLFHFHARPFSRELRFSP